MVWICNFLCLWIMHPQCSDQLNCDSLLKLCLNKFLPPSILLAVESFCQDLKVNYHPILCSEMDWFIFLTFVILSSENCARTSLWKRQNSIKKCSKSCVAQSPFLPTGSFIVDGFVFFFSPFDGPVTNWPRSIKCHLVLTQLLRIQRCSQQW